MSLQHAGVLSTLPKSDTVIQSVGTASTHESKLVQVSSTVGTPSFCRQLKLLFTFYPYVIGIPYVIFYFAGSYEQASWFAPYGASWFGGCRTWEDQQKNSDCLSNDDNYDYTTYNFNISIFVSLAGLVSFLFSGYIGRLSDAYGRKWIFILYLVTKLIPNIPLLFTDNIWYNFYLYPITGLNGGMNSATPIMIAYMADIISEEQRTLALGIMYVCGGIGLLIGAATGAIVTIIYGFYMNFWVVCMMWASLIVFSLFFQYESLPKELRKPMRSGQCYNPFRPLCQLTKHPIVFWIGILQLFISLPETGIIDMATVIVDDLLHVTNVNNATTLNSAFSAMGAMGNLFGNLLILPILTTFFNDLQILIVGASVLGLSFVSFGVVPFVVDENIILGYVFTFVGGFLLGVSFISFPAANSIVTRYLHESEEGEGMGIVYAMRSITFIIAPLGFASLYKLGSDIGFKSLAFVVGFGFALCALITVIFPLRRAIDKIKNKEKRMYYSTWNLKTRKENQDQYRII
eukprot:424596_1